MEPLILVVEDNPDVLKYIEIVLEHNDCRVLKAQNGEDALEKLTETDELPDVIVSDIMMPEMDGYDFFKALSTHAVYCNIPFIFLTALDTPDDVRLGKLLGADDYLTKPINEDELLVSIAGKVNRKIRNRRVNEQIKEQFVKYKEDFKTNLSEAERNRIVFIQVDWDDKLGPKLQRFYPPNIGDNYPVAEIGSQLYGAVSTIYGQDKIFRPEGIHIMIENFKLEGYAFFDSYSDPSFRGGEKDYMFAVIAPKIPYFHSLMIKRILQKISNKFKEKRPLNIEKYWNEISNILIEAVIV